MKNPMKMLSLIGVGVVLAASVLPSGPARAAFMPVIDEFWVVRNGVENFRDSFNDGVLPPSGPEDGIVSTGVTYTTQGTAGFTSETTGTAAQGKLTMTPALGDSTQISGFTADTFTGARRIRSTNPASGAFLGVNESFEIHGLFDLSALPTISGQSFGIRASDRSSTSDGKDVFSLFLARSSTTGNLIVISRDIDFVADTSQTVGVAGIQSFIDAGTAVQIELIIAKQAASDLLDASFILRDIGGNAIHTATLDNLNDVTGQPVQIYTDTDVDFTRAQFFSTDTGVAVPEPGALLMLGLGLAGLGYARRRRRTA